MSGGHHPLCLVASCHQFEGDGRKWRVVLEFDDDELRCLAYDASYHTKRWSTDVTKAYRKVIQLIDAAADERDLRAFKGLRLEQLKGRRAGTSAVRINSQYRLILRFTTSEDGRTAIVLEAVDYH